MRYSNNILKNKHEENKLSSISKCTQNQKWNIILNLKTPTGDFRYWATYYAMVCIHSTIIWRISPQMRIELHVMGCIHSRRISERCGSRSCNNWGCDCNNFVKDCYLLIWCLVCIFYNIYLNLVDIWIWLFEFNIIIYNTAI